MGKVKCFWSHMAHTATLISMSVALSDTPPDLEYHGASALCVNVSCLLFNHS